MDITPSISVTKKSYSSTVAKTNGDSCKHEQQTFVTAAVCISSVLLTSVTFPTCLELSSLPSLQSHTFTVPSFHGDRGVTRVQRSRGQTHGWC